MMDLLVVESVAKVNAADNVKVFIAPGLEGSFVSLKPRYENFIGGEWVPPIKGEYMNDVSPVNGKVFCEVARSTKEDVELALDAAHRARQSWGEAGLRRPREGTEQDRRRARGQSHHAGNCRELGERQAGSR